MKTKSIFFGILICLISFTGVLFADEEFKNHPLIEPLEKKHNFSSAEH
jgi:hypothetical protein